MVNVSNNPLNVFAMKVILVLDVPNQSAEKDVTPRMATANYQENVFVKKDGLAETVMNVFRTPIAKVPVSTTYPGPVLIWEMIMLPLLINGANGELGLLVQNPAGKDSKPELEFVPIIMESPEHVLENHLKPKSVLKDIAKLMDFGLLGPDGHLAVLHAEVD
jgi:hypothetical protein